MINMTSQLVSQPGSGANAPFTASRKSPESGAAGNKSREEVIPEVYGSKGSPSVEELAGAVKQLNGFLEETHRALRFSIDEDSGRTIIRVVDADTDEVIRQIPQEEMLALSRHLSEVTGKVFNAVA